MQRTGLQAIGVSGMAMSLIGGGATDNVLQDELVG